MHSLPLLKGNKKSRRFHEPTHRTCIVVYTARLSRAVVSGVLLPRPFEIHAPFYTAGRRVLGRCAALPWVDNWRAVWRTQKNPSGTRHCACCVLSGGHGHVCVPSLFTPIGRCFLAAGALSVSLRIHGDEACHRSISWKADLLEKTSQPHRFSKKQGQFKGPLPGET